MSHQISGSANPAGGTNGRPCWRDRPGVSGAVGDAREVPFADASFDAALLLGDGITPAIPR